jgi:hypothetical protein
VAVAITIGEPVRRSGRRLIWGLSIAVLVIGIVIGVIVAVDQGVQSLGRAVGNGVANALFNGAAEEAVTGANTAQTDGESIGQVTAAQIENMDPGDRWVPGVDASTGISIVSFIASDSHLVTAVNTAPGICAYGLYVASRGDPIVVAEKLPSGKVFAQSVSAEVPTTVGRCAASDAPLVGWESVPNADLS